MNNPRLMEVKSQVFNREKIKETYLPMEVKDKEKALWKNLYALQPDASIVFCNTKDKVKEVYEKLKREGIVVEQLHGDMEQKDRLKTMERFKNKEFKVLVATDIAARGIHVDNITHVINYEVPMERESYVHRIGRTGRAGKEGFAVTFVAPYERKFIEGIEEYLGYTIEKGNYPEDEAVKAGKIVFKESQKELNTTGSVKKKTIHDEVTKIYLSVGKKKKIRNIDIVGSLSNLPEINGEDIGIIDVQDTATYVDILNNKGKTILRNYKEIVVKGKKARVERARK